MNSFQRYVSGLSVKLTNCFVCFVPAGGNKYMLYSSGTKVGEVCWCLGHSLFTVIIITC